MIEAACGAGRQTPHPIIGLHVWALSLPVDHSVVVAGVRARLFAALLRPLVSKLWIWRAEAVGGLLIAHLLLPFFIVKLELVEGVEWGGKRDVGARVWLLQPPLSIPCIFIAMLLDPVFICFALLLDVGNFIMREVTSWARNCGREELRILIEEPPLRIFIMLEAMMFLLVGLWLKVVLADPRRFEDLGMALNLLKVAILAQGEIDFMLGTLLAVEGLIKAALGFVARWVKR